MKKVEKISDKNSDAYIDLPKYFELFQYPVSLELSKYIGRKAYQEEFVDPLEFFCILANKVYSTIVERGKANILSDFILSEKEGFKEKVSELILSVKRWENGAISDELFAKAIENFCLRTYGVRLPVISFFLRLLLPHKFGTLDIRATNALKSIGFKGIKDIPADETDKEAYFERYSGLDYLEYNALLLEIGRHYEIGTEYGEQRTMMPSEVDMALYMYDKLGGQAEIIVTRVRGEKANQTRSKIEKIMEIVAAVYNDAISVANEDWAKAPAPDGKSWSGKIRGSARKMKGEMDNLARQGNLEELYNYYIKTLGSERGMRIGELLNQCGKKSLESEFEKVKKIVED